MDIEVKMRTGRVVRVFAENLEEARLKAQLFRNLGVPDRCPNRYRLWRPWEIRKISILNMETGNG